VTRVEFRLSMPSRASWNNGWSGDDRNYTIVREFDDEAAAQLDGRSWSYRWSDGWVASVAARVVIAEASIAKSDGFCGYDWMVTSIMRYGKIFADHERPEVTA